MGGTSWGNGEVETKRYTDGEHRVLWFYNDDVIWYDVAKGIAKEGWEQELEHYEGGLHKGWPLNECPDWIIKK